MKPRISKSRANLRRPRIVVDCAGGSEGGAARFLRELQKYVAEYRPVDVELIGLEKKLTPQWLIQREAIASSATRRVSLNNASFINRRGENVTLLRNILHFATQTDLDSIGFTPSPRLRVQTPIIRKLAGASKKLVVPCTRMAEQVSQVVPSLENKLSIRFHPVSQPSWSGSSPKNPYQVLLPIVPWPYKNLDQHILEFLKASEGLYQNPVQLIVPSTPEEVLSGLSTHPRLKFIGQQTSEKFDKWWKNSAAVFFPTEFEAFGYPLAEARVYGRNVIAQDTRQNSEIAGAALKPYKRDLKSSLRNAIKSALEGVPAPEPEPFNPQRYFEWLLSTH